MTVKVSVITHTVKSDLFLVVRSQAEEAKMLFFLSLKHPDLHGSQKQQDREFASQ